MLITSINKFVPHVKEIDDNPVTFDNYSVKLYILKSTQSQRRSIKFPKCKAASYILQTCNDLFSSEKRRIRYYPILWFNFLYFSRYKSTNLLWIFNEILYYIVVKHIIYLNFRKVINEVVQFGWHHQIYGHWNNFRVEVEKYRHIPRVDSSSQWYSYFHQTSP